MILRLTGEGGEKRMNKGMILFCVALLVSAPLVGAAYQPQKRSTNLEETTTFLCIINGRRTERELSVSSIQDLIEMGGSHKEDFLTIYDKTKSADEVSIAFENIKPFFQALIEKGLTDKTIEELNALYYDIREKIKEPRRQPHGMPQDGPQPLAIWNGFPTAVWANAMCGQFDVGVCAGFAGGTHLLIPTIGIDLFLTYAFDGTSVTVGGLGYTIAVAGFYFVVGFVGILLVTPLIMFGPYFLAGMSCFVVGVGV